MNKEINKMYLMNGDKPIMQINNIQGGDLSQGGDLRYEYNTKYISRLNKYDDSFCINVSEPTDYQKIYKAFGIDKFKIPDKYNIKVSKLIPCKWHKKKRINKKMLKKHGHPNYVRRFETVKGWKLHSYTNGEFEFVKDGDEV